MQIPIRFLSSLTILALCSCVPKEKVSVIRPVNRNIRIDASNGSERLSQCLEAAHAAWRKIMESPSDAAALSDYNFAVSRTLTAIKDAGVVPYWSSHRSDVVSEKIVPSNHGAQRHPDAIDEVRRILELDLDGPP